MKIMTLFCRSANGSLTSFLPSDFTPFSFQTFGRQHLGDLLLIEGIHDNVPLYIDYSRLCTDHVEIAQSDQWSHIEDILTNNDEYRIGYTWDGISPNIKFPFSDVDVWDCMHTLHTFHINYGDEASDVNDVYALRWKLQDLRIALSDTASQKPHLAMSIPVVNGFFCYPIVRERNGEKVLYAKLGAPLCWQKGIHRTPEIQLLDFHRFGELIVHPFIFSTPDTIERPTESTDTCICENRTQTLNMNSRWKFITRMSLNEYTPIVVLGGVPFFPDQITVQHEHSFTIDPNKTPLNYALAYRCYLEDRLVAAANGAVTKPLYDYFKESSLQQISFIIYIKTRYVHIIRERMDVWSNYITVNNYTPDGMLLIDATGTLAPYHRESLSDRSELTLQNQESLFVLDKTYKDEQYLFFPPDCRHHHPFHKNLRESSCTMVYLMRGAR